VDFGSVEPPLPQQDLNVLAVRSGLGEAAEGSLVRVTSDQPETAGVGLLGDRIEQ
jgi:hypothetical protein